MPINSAPGGVKILYDRVLTPGEHALKDGKWFNFHLEAPFKDDELFWVVSVSSLDPEYVLEKPYPIDGFYEGLHFRTVSQPLVRPREVYRACRLRIGLVKIDRKMSSHVRS